MWINEAEIELIAMTSHNCRAVKWEYVVDSPESSCFKVTMREKRKKVH